MSASGRLVLALLGTAATLPFVATSLAGCTRRTGDADAGAHAGAGADADADAHAGADASADAGADADAHAGAHAHADAGPHAGAAATPTSFVMGPSNTPSGSDIADCRKLQADHDRFVAAHRACATDIDCTFAYASCGLEGVCGTPMRAGDTAALKPLDDAFVKRGCMAALVVPCPTCAPPGKVRCKDGTCVAER